MKCFLITLSVVIGLMIAGTFAVSQFSVSATPEPGKLETYLATSAIHVLVHRSSREPIPAAPSNLKASTEEGDKLFVTECAACHGLDGLGRGQEKCMIRKKAGNFRQRWQTFL